MIIHAEWIVLSLKFILKWISKIWEKKKIRLSINCFLCFSYSTKHIHHLTWYLQNFFGLTTVFISILQIRKLEHWKITLVNQIHILQYGRTSQFKWNKIPWVQMPFTYKYTQLNYMWMLNSEHFCIFYPHEVSCKNYFFRKHDSVSKNLYLFNPFSVTIMIDFFVIFSYHKEKKWWATESSENENKETTNRGSCWSLMIVLRLFSEW